MQTLRYQGNLKQIILISSLAMLLMALILAGYAPYFLAYSDRPVKSDAVVIFLGGEFSARKSEVKALIDGGYARHIIIPATREILGPIDDGSAIQIEKWLDGIAPSLQLFASKPAFFESTHIEIMQAMLMIKKYNFKSTIFVSSPSHMRRIKIITEHVFHDLNETHGRYRIYFVPTSIEEPPSLSWFLNKKRISQMALEYIKISMFLFYALIP